jgi:site-specific DNA-cytosine methylase
MFSSINTLLNNSLIINKDMLDKLMQSSMGPDIGERAQSWPELSSIGSACSGCGTFEQASSAVNFALNETLHLCREVKIELLCEVVKQKLEFLRQNIARSSSPNACLYDDVTTLADEEKRWCVTHKAHCPVPSDLTGVCAGFSCKDYSPLNPSFKDNKTAMKRRQDI